MSTFSVLANNCVSEIKIPKKIEAAHSVDYNPVLRLCATDNRNRGRISVWNPVSKKVVASISTTCDGFSEAIFLPGDRIGVSASEANHGGSVEIYSIDAYDKRSRRRLTIEGEQLPTVDPGPIALSPRKTLLLADATSNCSEIFEIFVDWDNLKVLKSSTIDLSIAEHEEDEREKNRVPGTYILRCLPDFIIISCELGSWGLSVAKVRVVSKEEVKCEERHKITYYMLEGEKKELKDRGCPVDGVVHDGEHLIIANGDEVVLLESLTEGSTAHLIANIEVNDFNHPGLAINEKGQLIVCNDTVIKVFEYNCNPRTLMALCRRNIRKNTQSNYRSRVNKLAIPQVQKDYLLYE